MKIYIFLVIAFISIAFSACDLNGSSNNTPQILFVTEPMLNSKDNLSTYLTDEAGVYRLDSINVGDTVSFRILLNGFSNHLTSYFLTRSDTAAIKMILPSNYSMDSVFLTSSSDYSIGKFIFKTNIFNLYFPFKYVALKPTNDAKISFSLTSDANFDGSMSLGNNSVNFVLKTPIKVAISISNVN